MCADFALHDTGNGNPHAHILLTMRPMDERGQWLPKSKKEYVLDENGERVKLPSGRYKTRNENIEKFIQKAQKYMGIGELDPYALRELVQAIYVDAPDKSSGKRRQHIHIKYDGLGFIPLDELMKEETA